MQTVLVMLFGLHSQTPVAKYAEMSARKCVDSRVE